MYFVLNDQGDEFAFAAGFRRLEAMPLKDPATVVVGGARRRDSIDHLTGCPAGPPYGIVLCLLRVRSAARSWSVRVCTVPAFPGYDASVRVRCSNLPSAAT